MRKVAIIGIAFLLALPLSFLAPELKANASANCYASTCTGEQAETEGCSADAYTAETVKIYDLILTAQEDGYVQLRYSPTCRSTWAKVFWTPTGAEVVTEYPWAKVQSSKASLHESCTVSTTGSECQTAMIDDLNPLTSVASGGVPGFNESFNSASTSPPF